MLGKTAVPCLGPQGRRILPGGSQRRKGQKRGAGHLLHVGPGDVAQGRRWGGLVATGDVGTGACCCHSQGSAVDRPRGERAVLWPALRPPVSPDAAASGRFPAAPKIGPVRAARKYREGDGPREGPRGVRWLGRGRAGATLPVSSRLIAFPAGERGRYVLTGTEAGGMRENRAPREGTRGGEVAGCPVGDEGPWEQSHPHPPASPPR